MDQFNCDRCGVNAWPHGVRAVSKDGRDVTLCGHHNLEHGPALVKQGFVITPTALLQGTA